MSSDETWHLVEARRDGGKEDRALFRIRDLAPEPALSTIFVVELPYRTSEMSQLPDAKAYRRLSQFEEQWLRPSCSALGWQFVAAKIEDGSTFLYCYGAGDPNALLEKLAPFDGSLAFYDEKDPEWQEYAAIKDLLDEAESLKQVQPSDAVEHIEAKLTQPIRNPSAKDKTAVPSKSKSVAESTETPAQKAHEAELFTKSGAPKLSAKAGAMKPPKKGASSKKAAAKLSAKAGAKKSPKARAKKSAKKPAAKKAAAKKSSTKKSGKKKR